MITEAQRNVLTIMRDNDEELIYESGECWVGLDQIAKRDFFALLGLAALRMDQYSTVGKCERYTINQTGRELLRPVNEKEPKND